MEILNFWDLLIIKVSLFGIFISFVGSVLQRSLRSNKTTTLNPHSVTSKRAKSGPALAPTRSIKKRLEQAGKKCVVFYGTQTGTAEKFALIMARELNARLNLPSMTADLDDYDHVDLTLMEPDQLAIFILATYGEGEPTDNAITFNTFLELQKTDACISSAKTMSSLKYAAFGLGSSSYQFFNGMITRVDESLQACGATRIGSVGLGDDGKGTLETDFMSWKDATLDSVAETFVVERIEYQFKPAFEITEAPTSEERDVFLGEPNKSHLHRRITGPFTAQNPYPARIMEAKELFTTAERNCLHLEFDVSATTITYETGDHLAVWPVNSDLEVDRYLKALSLLDKRDQVIQITSKDPTTKVPIPSKTTYDAAARYYLDICAPVSQQALAILASLVSGSTQKALQTFASDSDLFQREISDRLLNFAQTLELLAATDQMSKIPFSFFLENVTKLQPRYYSISSSSTYSRGRISITAVVESSDIKGSDTRFKGVATNYLLAMKHQADAELHGGAGTQALRTHRVRGPRNIYSHPTVLIHVRRSNFRLPRNPATPVIMIGPGTGVAPFRGFVQERALQARAGRAIGRTILFYGCRRKDEDFLYKDEWESYCSSFTKDEFSMSVAFSREASSKKQYVQDLVRSRGEELRELILNHGAHVYVCGEASCMAKDVFRTFAGILDISIECSGEEYLRTLKATGRWSEDVW